MKGYLFITAAVILSAYACEQASSSANDNDLYALADTGYYKLTNTLQGGVFARTEIYTHQRDTSLSYVKVFNFDQQVAAIQFYKGTKKHGPTITYNEKGQKQLGTFYRNDTAVDMHSFSK